MPWSTSSVRAFRALHCGWRSMGTVRLSWSGRGAGEGAQAAKLSGVGSGEEGRLSRLERRPVGSKGERPPRDRPAGRRW